MKGIMVLFWGVFFIPVLVSAQGGIVPCTTYEGCKFAELIQLVENALEFLIYGVASPIAAIMFAYAGFLYFTAQGNETKVKQGHDIFISVFWGYVIMLSAWAIVNFILNLLLPDGSDLNLLE